MGRCASVLRNPDEMMIKKTRKHIVLVVCDGSSRGYMYNQLLRYGTNDLCLDENSQTSGAGPRIE